MKPNGGGVRYTGHTFGEFDDFVMSCAVVVDGDFIFDDLRTGGGAEGGEECYKECFDTFHYDDCGDVVDGWRRVF